MGLDLKYSCIFIYLIEWETVLHNSNSERENRIKRKWGNFSASSAAEYENLWCNKSFGQSFPHFTRCPFALEGHLQSSLAKFYYDIEIKWIK